MRFQQLNVFKKQSNINQYKRKICNVTNFYVFLKNSGTQNQYFRQFDQTIDFVIQHIFNDNRLIKIYKRREEHRSMNLKKSTYKNTQKDKLIQQMQLKVIDETYSKSYIFQVAPKTIRKPKSTQQQLRQSNRKQHQSLLKSSQIFKSCIRNQVKTNEYKVLMSQVLPKKNVQCCGSDGKSMVNVVLSQFREIQIRGAQKNNMEEVLYRVNFNTVEAHVDAYDIDQQSFMLDVCKKVVLKFENIQRKGDTAKKLKQALKNMVTGSLGVQFHMSKICQYENFHKNAYKSCTQFAQNCQTGDILLFRGNLFWAKVQRFVSNSQYDHVGLLYKDPIHGILIFQATSVSGICLTPWDFVIKYKWYQFIDRITWRRLEGVERSQSFLQKMRQAIINKVGKSYHISLDKLMSNQSVIYGKPLPPITQQSPQIPSSCQQPQTTPTLSRKQTSTTSTSNPNSKQQIGYFCSQLVAKMYKQVGVLISNKQDKNFKPSCNFYPYHFTQKYDMIMVDKAKLSKEYVICFDQKEIQSYYGQGNNEDTGKQ